MKKILQINVAANIGGSTGRIAEGIGQVAIKAGWKSYIAYGRYANPSQSELIKIGNKWDVYNHVLQTRLFDKHGLASKSATKKLIQQIEQITPDIIHLHNIHGYYLNYPILFAYLSKSDIPVVWTLHDCWPFTGHCAHWAYSGCEKWKTGCEHCPRKRGYPSSWFVDRSKRNYTDKKNAFTAVLHITFVPVSDWLGNFIPETFMKNYPVHRIYNGVDLSVFQPRNDKKEIFKQYQITTKHCVLAVTNVWTASKGYNDLRQISSLLGDDCTLVMVGVNEKQQKELPANIKGILRTENITHLADLYAAADVFINPTYADSFPTTNLEALACGTPVITYRTGGSPEAISSGTGFVVEQGDIQGMVSAIEKICQGGKDTYSKVCRDRAVRYFNKEERFQEYIDLYNQILSK